MKVSELARRAGVSKETIHFYLREGLLPKPRKAGRNMAFYDDAHLERIALIKKLQHERYLPLGVIKQVLRADRESRPPISGGGPELELLAELFALTVGRDHGRPVDEDGVVTRAQLLARTGVPGSLLASLEAAGLVTAQGGRYHVGDARIVELITRAQAEAGFSPEFAVKIFALYRRHLTLMARDEAQLYSQEIVAAERPLEYVEGLRRAREVTNRFLLLERARLIQHEIERHLSEVERVVAGDGEPPLWEASPSLRAAGAEDRAARQPGDDDLDALETRLRAEPPTGLTRALLGSALVRKARRALRAEGGKHAMRLMTDGIAELAASEAPSRAGGGGPGELLLAQLVRGRVYVALPRFFGAWERGLRELARVAAEGTDPGAPATLRWLAANASYFTGWALAVEPARRGDARVAFVRAALLDHDGPLARRARERITELDRQEEHR